MNTLRLEKEANIRKKLEEALKDAPRTIADKEVLLQDARNEAAKQENAHIETKQDRDGLLATLIRTQQTLEVEMTAKDDLQNLANQLKEKFDFQQQLSEKLNHTKKGWRNRQKTLFFDLLLHCCVCYPHKVLTEADPGGGLMGLQTPPLGSFQTCLATHVYPFFIPKIVL